MDTYEWMRAEGVAVASTFEWVKLRKDEVFQHRAMLESNHAVLPANVDAFFSYVRSTAYSSTGDD
jgi:hypothetical protein